MTTLTIKVWIVTMFLGLNPPVTEGTQTEVCINVDHNLNRTAFMDGQRVIRYIPGTDWTDGDVAEVTLSGNEIVTATKQGIVWRYDGHGTFTEVSYPWWYTGAKPGTIKSEVAR